MNACRVCNLGDRDLRYGVCFDCASSAEERAAKRTVIKHFAIGLYRLFWVHRWNSPMHWFGVKTEFKWAWERLTRTGDYAKDGTFDWEGYDWR